MYSLIRQMAFVKIQLIQKQSQLIFWSTNFGVLIIIFPALRYIPTRKKWGMPLQSGLDKKILPYL